MKIFCLLALAFSLPAQALTLPQFQEKMRAHMKALPEKARASVQIEVLGRGPVLFSHNEKEKIIPASSTKLITVIAALEQLKPGYTFETKVLQKGQDLYLVGNGDPYLVSEKLWLLARDVARSGIKEVGAIKVNNAAFTDNYRGLIDWDNSGEPFTAVVSPTSLNFNSLEIHVVPSAKENKPRIEVGPLPNAYAVLRNEVTQTNGSRKSLSVRPMRVDGNKEIFMVSGSIGRDAKPTILYASVNLPESHIAHAFAALLRQEGVKVAQDFGGSSFAPLEGGKEIATLEGLPLMDLVRLLNTYSNNFMTEQLFLALGASVSGGPASLGKSQKVAQEFLRQREGCKDAVLENGSGLSWTTQISARCFVETFQTVYRDFRVFADLLGSLPVGGQTGTLKTRFRKTGAGFDPLKVRAKTGTLWSKQVVTSLTGFTQTGSGETVAFALIENDSRNDPGLLQTLKDWEDKCVEYIQQLRL